MRSRTHFVIAFAIALLAGLAFAATPGRSESDRLISLLQLQPGATVADIGAGDGDLSIALARKLGPRSLIYSTELKKALPDLRRAVKRAKVKNVLLVEAGARKTNLPARCCDAIFIRRVYHHFQDARSENQSVFRNLRPGGLLAIIDFQPKKHWEPPEGVHHRGGHGVDRGEMIREVTAAGFELVRIEEDWPEDMYAVLFRKPESRRVKSRR